MRVRAGRAADTVCAKIGGAQPVHYRYDGREYAAIESFVQIPERVELRVARICAVTLSADCISSATDV